MTQRRDVADLGVGGLAQRRLHDAEVHPGCGEVWAETDGALQQLLGLDVLAARLQDVCQVVHRLVVARVQAEARKCQKLLYMYARTSYKTAAECMKVTTNDSPNRQSVLGDGDVIVSCISLNFTDVVMNLTNIGYM